MRTKIVPLQIKTVPTDGSGEFTGLASTFGGEPDFQGDVVEYGAFAESIIRWGQLGDMPPVGLNHDYSSASSRIGKLTSMLEIPEGLLVSGRLNLKSEAAMAAYEAMLVGSLDAMSIGYEVIEQHKRGDKVNVLTKLNLIEVSLTPIPANPRARVLQVKSASAFAPAQMANDNSQWRCSCGKFGALPYRPTTALGQRVYVATCSGCGRLWGVTPFTTEKHVRALREIKGRQIMAALATLGKGGAPADVLRSAFASARFAVNDVDYTVADFKSRLFDLVDSAVDDEAVQREALADRNVKAMLDDVEAALNVRGSKPWRVEERDGRFCVIKLTDNSTVDCFDSRAEAEAQVRALYANESEKARHPVPNSDSVIDLQTHLNRFHSSQTNRDTVLGMDLGALRTLHAVCHPNDEFDVTAIVNPATSMPGKSLSSRAVKMLAEYDAAERGTKAITDREREEHERFVEANEALLAGPIPSPAEDAAREASRRATEDQERERLSNERAQRLADAQAADDASRDNRGWRQSGASDFYTETLGVTEPVTDTPRAPMPEPRITDATVAPDSFAIPIKFVNVGEPLVPPYTDGAWNIHRDLPVDERPVEGAIHGEGETVRVNTAQRANDNRRIEKEAK